MPKMHDLKTWPGPFRDIKAGRKTFEYRRDDRDYRGMSSHGLRSGFITEAYKAGISDEEIMGHTRHRSPTSMRGYVRRERLNGESPAALVGL